VHGRYSRVPTKNVPKLYTRVTPTVPSPTNKNKQQIVGGGFSINNKNNNNNNKRFCTLYLSTYIVELG